MFITFEGGEKSGKTTQARALAVFLRNAGLDIVLTRDPGGTHLGEKIREILLEYDDGRPTTLAEALLYAASRAQLVEEIISPGLSQGKIVICDRFVDSSLAYQGYGLGLDLDIIRRINEEALREARPDLTLLLDLDPDHADKRTTGKRDRIERRNADFHRRVRAGYLEMAALEPERIKIIDAALPVAEVGTRIRYIASLALSGKGIVPPTPGR